MFREVSIVEVREVLRLWLMGHSQRAIARLAQADRKTVRRYLEAALRAGLERGGGEEQLSDELLGSVAEELRSGRMANVARAGSGWGENGPGWSRGWRMGCG